MSQRLDPPPKGNRNHIGLIDFFDFVVTFLSDQGTACRESMEDKKYVDPKTAMMVQSNEKNTPIQPTFEGVGFIVAVGEPKSDYYPL
jgi:hypothetical protein